MKIKSSIRIILLISFCICFLIPSITLLTTPQVEAESPSSSGYFVKTVMYEGECFAHNYWWIFKIERMHAEMWVQGDMWYSEALDGWYFVNAYWFFPRITTDTVGGYHFYVDYILNEKEQVGPYIYEISQTIYGKLYKGSSYKWITMKLTITTGNGNGAGIMEYTLGSGSLSMIWSKKASSLSNIMENIMDYYPGEHPPY